MAIESDDDEEHVYVGGDHLLLRDGVGLSPGEGGRDLTPQSGAPARPGSAPAPVAHRGPVGGFVAQASSDRGIALARIGPDGEAVAIGEGHARRLDAVAGM